MVLESPIAAALNYLLESEPWARERLSPFSGDAVALRLPFAPPVALLIEADGRVSPAPPGVEPAVTVTLRPLQRPEWQGESRLAEVLSELARTLRWDAEEDLSRVVGDVAAHRIAGLARGLLAWQADAGRRLTESLADYASEEKRWLVQKSDLRRFAEQLAALEAGIEALDARVHRLA
jgi:ubiquinone biosynthesis protein UbiJ